MAPLPIEVVYGNVVKACKISGKCILWKWDTVPCYTQQLGHAKWLTMVTMIL